MAKMDWDKVKTTKKKQLIQAARFDSPLTIKAKFASTCKHCGNRWEPGAPIRQSLQGWVHAKCAETLNDDLHNSMASRRARLAAERTAPPQR